MFWGGKKKEDDRTKQVNKLKHAFPSIRRPNNDDNIFEFRFTVDGQYSTLRLSVPEDFPQGVPGEWIMLRYFYVSLSYYYCYIVHSVSSCWTV